MATGQELFDADIAKIKLKIKKSPSSAVTKRLVRELRNLQEKPGNQRTGIEAKGGTKGKYAVDTGKQAHHRTSLNNAAAFFEDLDIPEKVIMGQKFAQYGLTPGDLTTNRLDMFSELHQGGIHSIERYLNLEGKQYFKAGASLQQKLAAVEEFAADQKLLASIADRMQFTAEQSTFGLSRRIESTATNKLAEEYITKRGRRLKNQKLDFLEYIPENHEVARALGPQMQSNNANRLAALEQYFNPDGTFDKKRLKADKDAGIFTLPKAGPATEFSTIPLDISKGSVKFKRGQRLANNVLKLGVGGSLAVGLQSVASKAQAGDFEGAVGEGIAALVGEVPFIGDALVMESEGRAAGERMPSNVTPDQYTQMQIQKAKNLKSIPEQISNEAKWAVNNPGEAIKNVTEATLTTALAAGKQAFDSPMLAPYTTPIKAINGAMKFFGF